MTAFVPPLSESSPSLITRIKDGELNGSRNMLLGLAVLAFGATLVGALTAEGGFHNKGFLISYLTAWMYGVSICLGALFFVMIQHLTRAGWSVTVRRLAEHVAANIWIFVPLYIPILMGFDELYGHWTHAAEHNDTIVMAKSGYLNKPFFFVRLGIYFVAWILLAQWFRRTSLKQDETGDPQLTLTMSRRAAPGILVFALTVTFAAFDWSMSLDPHWYSTIFGIVFFAGSFVAFLAYGTVLFKWLSKKGYYQDSVNKEHYHDLGKLMFAFIVFWTYTSFSQYFLIWYANVPEETVWFQLRKNETWDTVFYALVFGHFLIPFAFLLTRHTKRSGAALVGASCYLLVMHWVDLHFYIAPTASHGGGGHGGDGGAGALAEAGHGWLSQLSWVDAAAPLAMLFMICGLTIKSLGKHPIVPERDPRLQEALHFHNI